MCQSCGCFSQMVTNSCLAVLPITKDLSPYYGQMGNISIRDSWEHHSKAKAHFEMLCLIICKCYYFHWFWNWPVKLPLEKGRNFSQALALDSLGAAFAATRLRASWERLHPQLQACFRSLEGAGTLLRALADQPALLKASWRGGSLGVVPELRASVPAYPLPIWPGCHRAFPLPSVLFWLYLSPSLGLGCYGMHLVYLVVCFHCIL